MGGQAQYYRWPTAEMESRMTVSALFPGLVVALASGIGAANAVQPDGDEGIRTNEVVGVAISASLLPPLINTGMILACGFFSTLPLQMWYSKAMISFSLTALNVAGVIICAACFFRYRIRDLVERSIRSGSGNSETPPS